MKYGGEMYDVLESKLFIFRDSCYKVRISQSQFAGAFSIMLKDEASDFYFNYISDNATLDFHDLVSCVKQHFETEEARQTYLSEWRNTTLL
ncbi:glycosyl transferase [Colletotrichum kahawae]|uniref:Glycosyl transferase n=1 Tax=Colletotrichum kahawae TaxID=34407 RepID=A0AAE0D7S5_COLKA|nr:glycosyl transferase [Colletotrichum kahawae]